MTFQTIIYERADGVALISLNRPDKLNAVSPKMVDELLEAFDAVDGDDEVRATIVTGSGRAFCSGADLSGGALAFDFDKRPDKVALGSPIRPNGSVDYSHQAVRDNGGRIALRIFECLKPVIGAINGPAVGLGFTMTLPMDIRIASHAARFCAPFTRRGIVPEAGSTWFLPRLVGISTALEWCLSGAMIEASEALERGLVRSLMAPEDLLSTARQLAAGLVGGTAPVSVALTRQLLWRGLAAREPFDAHRIESRGVYDRGRSADAREGVAAYLEKRTAEFPDRVSAGMPDFYPWWHPRTFD